jgi:hypothetical protein
MALPSVLEEGSRLWLRLSLFTWHGGADNSSKPTKSAAANFFEATKQMQGTG